jgi:hypothetical protein
MRPDRALLGRLARPRRFAIIEEALLLRELVEGLGLSQHDVAQRCGRDVGQPASAPPVGTARCGAGGGARRQFVELDGQPGHGTRWRAPTPSMPCACWRRCRPGGVAELVRALPAGSTGRPRAHGQPRTGRVAPPSVRDGPKGACNMGDLRCLEAVIARLRKRVATLRPVPPRLIAAAPRLRAPIDPLTTALEREDMHDPDGDPRRGCAAYPRSAAGGCCRAILCGTFCVNRSARPPRRRHAMAQHWIG